MTDLSDIVKRAADAAAAARSNVPPEILALAREAAVAADKVRSAAVIASDLRRRLLDMMLSGGITRIPLDDRDAIEIKVRRRQRRTFKALLDAMDKEEAKRVWSLFPYEQVEEIVIPSQDVEPV